MGSGQSVRATHFQHPIATVAESAEDRPCEEHHISISNKMVERLVEDAALVGTTVKSVTVPIDNHNEKMNIDNLKSMDEKHSKEYGIMVEDLRALMTRVERRTANMAVIEPVCAECRNRVLEGYQAAGTPENLVNCSNAVGAFSACVENAARERLNAHSEREAQEREKRQRRVAHARNHELRKLGAPTTVQ